MRIGRSDRFAIDLDWISNRDLQERLAPADAATWAGMRVHAAGHLLTASVNTVDVYSEQVFGSPLPLCLWALEHWGELIATDTRPVRGGAENPFAYIEEVEAELDDSEESDDLAETIRLWWEAHNIRGGRAGMALPDLFLWRQGPWITLWWRSDEAPFANSNLRFLPGEGRAQVEVACVVEVFTELFAIVEERLNSQGVTPEDDWRVEEFRRLYRERTSEPGRLRSVFEESGLDLEMFSSATGIPEDEFEAVLAGARPAGGVWDRVADAMDLPREQGVPTLNILAAGSGVLALFRSAAPTLHEEDVQELLALVREARTDQRPSAALDALRARALELRAEAGERQPSVAHLIGQMRARLARAALGLPPEAPADVEGIVTELLGRPVLGCRLSDHSIDGVSLWSHTISPVVAINEHSRMGSTQWGRRMALAHELCHLIFDSAAGRTLGIASGDWAPPVLEKIANAFAAEFLLPKSAIDAWPGDLSSAEQFIELMDRFTVGVRTAAWQLQNHRAVSPSVAQYYMETYASRPHLNP